MKVKVKICGIRSMEAAKAAVDAGTDFLGFNFVTASKRYINPFDAAKIIKGVKSKVDIVGVFQDAEITEVNKIASDLQLDFVQLHGAENNEYIAKISIPVIKSIAVNDQPDKIKADYLLLDRPKRGKGEMADLDKAAELAVNYLLFYAGGLTCNNVAGVVSKVLPYAVDVAGGIETDDHQDLEKIRLFVRNAKEVTL